MECGEGRIEGDDDFFDGGGRVADLEADFVEGVGVVGWGEGFDVGEDFGNSGHGRMVLGEDRGREGEG